MTLDDINQLCDEIDETIAPLQSEGFYLLSREDMEALVLKIEERMRRELSGGSA